MKRRELGQSGLAVGAVGLGAMPLSIAGRPDEAQGIAVIHAALDAGISLIDTANVYCLDDDDIGHNERLIARAMAQLPASRREGVIVATKGGLRRPGGDWVTDGRPSTLRASCEASLRALGLEALELYQLHAPDPEVPLADSVGTLAELQQQGKLRHVGLSNVDVDQIERAREIVEVVSVQNRYNLFDRGSDDVVAHCAREGIAFLPYSTVGGHRGHRRTAEHPVLARIAADHGATPYQVCLAWLLQRAPVVIPIPGASKPASARSSAAATGLTLSREQVAACDAIGDRSREDV